MLLADVQSSDVLLGLDQKLHALLMLTVLQEEISCNRPSNSHLECHPALFHACLAAAIMLLPHAQHTLTKAT